MTNFIAIDKRERDVLCYLQELAPDYARPEHLTTGDYILFINNTPVYVIERKTWADLSASIKDGRMNNIDKLRSYRDKTGAKIAYLMEGSTPNPLDEVDHIPYKCLRSHLDHLMFRDDVQEIYSKHPYDSARRLIELLTNLSTLKIQIGTDEKKDGPSALQIAKEKIVIDDTTNQINMWCALPSIAKKTAHILVDSKYTFKGVYDARANADFKAELEVKIGKARAEIILNLFDRVELAPKIIAAIHGISSQTALSLLRCCSFVQMLTEWDLYKDKLIHVKIGKGTIGKIRVEKLGQLLGV